MTDQTAAFVDRCADAIRKIEDPAELQRQLREMVEEQFPVPPMPVFLLGEKLKMHEFLSRYQSKICGGIVPKFYGVDCEIVASDAESVAIRIPTALPRAAGETQRGLERSEQGERLNALNDLNAAPQKGGEG